MGMKGITLKGKGKGRHGDTHGYTLAIAYLGLLSPMPVHGHLPSFMSHGGLRTSSFVGDGEGHYMHQSWD